MKLLEIKTFGCKLNRYDSALLGERLKADEGLCESSPQMGSESGPINQRARDSKSPRGEGAKASLEAGAGRQTEGESESLNRRAGQSGPAKSVFIFNTCAVTAEAGRDIRREAARLKKKNPGAFLVVTGCGAQVETELYAKNPWVDLVVGNSHKKDLPSILKDKLAAKEERPFAAPADQGSLGAASLPRSHEKVYKSSIFKSSGIYSGLISPEENRTRAFLKIQDGCDSFCSFCVIPFARGKSRSLPISRILEAARKLTGEGAEEIVLTGVHIGDYSDGEKGLEDLVRSLLRETAVPRLRLSSLEPPDLTDRLLECYGDERLCPHFHLSVQSASSSVLRSMKRKYGRKDVERAFSRIAKGFPKAFVGLDLIAGFPSESEEDFQETYQVLKERPWTKIHVFPYSPREGTYSARKAGFGRKEILRRAGQIRSLSGFRYESERNRQTGTLKKALLFKGDSRKGLSRDYWRVSLPPSSRKGEQRVLIQGPDPKSDFLRGAFL